MTRRPEMNRLRIQAPGALVAGGLAILAAWPVMAESSLVGPDALIAALGLVSLAVSSILLEPGRRLPVRSRLSEGLGLLASGIAAACGLVILFPFALVALGVSGAIVDPTGGGEWNVFLTMGLWSAGPLGWTAILLILRIRPAILTGALACAAIAGAPLALADWRYWPFVIAAFAAGAVISLLVRRATDDGAAAKPA